MGEGTESTHSNSPENTPFCHSAETAGRRSLQLPLQWCPAALWGGCWWAAAHPASPAIAWDTSASGHAGVRGGARCRTGWRAVPYPGGGSSRLLSGRGHREKGQPFQDTTWKGLFLLGFRPAEATSGITPLMVSGRCRSVGATVRGQERVPAVHPRGGRTLAHACGPVGRCTGHTVPVISSCSRWYHRV